MNDFKRLARVYKNKAEKIFAGLEPPPDAPSAEYYVTWEIAKQVDAAAFLRISEVAEMYQDGIDAGRVTYQLARKFFVAHIVREASMLRSFDGRSSSQQQIAYVAEMAKALDQLPEEN